MVIDYVGQELVWTAKTTKHPDQFKYVMLGEWSKTCRYCEARRS